jgi:hypothetical protein
MIVHLNQNIVHKLFTNVNGNAIKIQQNVTTTSQDTFKFKIDKIVQLNEACVGCQITQTFGDMLFTLKKEITIVKQLKKNYKLSFNLIHLASHSFIMV